MDDEPVLTTAVVTCHTPGCANEAIPITLLVTDVVVCGPCGQVITDVVPA